MSRSSDSAKMLTAAADRQWVSMTGRVNPPQSGCTESEDNSSSCGDLGLCGSLERMSALMFHVPGLYLMMKSNAPRAAGQR